VRCNRNPNESAQLLALVRTLNKSAPGARLPGLRSRANLIMDVIANAIPE